MYSPARRFALLLGTRSAGCQVRAFCNTACRTSSIPGEPVKPSIKTSIPGPRTQQIVKDLDNVFDTRSLKMIVDYRKSLGN